MQITVTSATFHIVQTRTVAYFIIYREEYTLELVWFSLFSVSEDIFKDHS